ncbi:hypothetical protein GCM10018953_21760 [Streptosporangium nondiastaticum]
MDGVAWAGRNEVTGLTGGMDQGSELRECYNARPLPVSRRRTFREKIVDRSRLAAAA